MPHHDDTFNAVTVFARFTVDAEDADLRCCADLHAPDVADKDRHAIRCVEDKAFDIGYCMNFPAASCGVSEECQLVFIPYSLLMQSFVLLFFAFMLNGVLDDGFITMCSYRANEIPV